MLQSGRDARKALEVISDAQALVKAKVCAFFIAKKVQQSKTSVSALRYIGAVIAIAFVFVPLSAVIGVLQFDTATAQTNTLNFQGRILTNTGSLVPDGDYNIEFKLYDSAAAGASSQGACVGGGTDDCVWVETRTGGNQVSIRDGYYSVYLGDVTALPNIDWSQPLWLTMNIGGTGSPSWDGEMSPRFRLTSVPYAFTSRNVSSDDTNAGSTDSDDVTIQTGDALGATSDSGDITIDVGTATGTTGSISLGTANASALNLGSAGASFALNSTAVDISAGGIISGATGLTSSGTIIFSALDCTGNGNNGKLTANGSGVISCADDVGGGAAATSINTLAGTLTLQGTANEIEVTDNGSDTITIGLPDDVIIGSDLTVTDTLTVNSTSTFNGNITISAGDTLRLVGDTTLNRPAGVAGEIYYDTDTNTLLTYNGTKWVADRGEYTIVAADDSSQAEKDVADYVADGTSDETEINNALLAATGGKVVLLEGTFIVDAPIVVPSNTTLEGLGSGTVIELDDLDTSTPMIINAGPTATGVVVRDLALDGRDDLNTGLIFQTGVSFVSVGDVSAGSPGGIIENVSARRFRGAAIFISGSEGVTVKNNSLTANIVGISLSNSVSNNITGNDVNGSSAGGIELSSSTDNVISSNAVSGNDNGIVLNSSNNNSITANSLTSNTTSGIELDGSSTNSVTSNTINSNGTGVFIDIGGGNVISSNVLDGNDGALSFYSSYDGSITGNTISNSVVFGISIDNSAGNVFSSNTFSENAGINLELFADNDDNLIIGNSFYDTTASGYAIDIVDATNTGTYIADNRYFGTGAASINDAGTDTIYGGQVDASGNYDIQPTGTIELLANTNVTGTFSVSSTSTFTGLATFNGGLTIETGDTFTFNSDAFTDLTGTGLQINSGSLEVILGDTIESGEITDGTITGTDIDNNTIVNGNLVNSQLAVNTGSGLTGGGNISLGGSRTLSLSDLTADWVQAGGYDIVLDNAGSELRIRESSGIFYGEIDITDLSADRLYTFPDVDGDVTVLGQTIDNGELANSSVTVNAGTGLNGGGLVALGGSVTLNNDLGTSIDGTEIDNGTVEAIDLEVTGPPTDDYILTYDSATGGFTWIDPAAAGVTLSEAEVEAFIFDGDNSGTLSSGTLALGSLSYTGVLTDTNVSDTLTIGASSTVDDGALSANVSLLGSSIALGTETTGNYVASITSGNGIQGGTSGVGSTPTLALGNLTTNWNQSGDFDIILDSTDSQLQILDDGGTYYGTFNVNSLAADQTYNFADGGTVITSGNISSNATTGVTAGAGLTGGGATGLLSLDIGAGTGITVNANDIEVDYGSSAGTAVEGDTTITINGGTGLSGGGLLTLGAGGTLTLNSDLGDSVDSSEIVDNTIQEEDLELTNAPTDDYVLTYDSTSGGFTWVSQASVGGAGGVASLNTLTGALSIQGNTQIDISPSGSNINLSINADSIGDAQLAFDTGQNLTTSDDVTFNTLAVATINTGNGNLEVNTIAGFLGDQNLRATDTPTFDGLTLDAASGPAGDDVRFTSATLQSCTALETDASGYLTCGTDDGDGVGVSSVDVSGGTTGLTTSGGPVTSTGTITLQGTLAITNGGTGAITAAGARTNLGLEIGTDVQAYNANTTILGSTIEGSEITNGTIEAIDLESTNVAGAGTDNYLVSYDNATGGFTYIDGGTVGTTLSEAEVEAFIFDGDNSGTLSSGTLALNSLSYTGNLTVAEGGTGLTAAGAAGGVYYSTGTAFANSGAGTAGQCLLSNGAGAPTWGNCGGSGAGAVTLQVAYNQGNVITTTNARDLNFTLANTTTDSDFIVNIAASSTSEIAFQNNGSTLFRVDSGGIDLLDVDTADFTGATVTFDAGEILETELAQNTLDDSEIQDNSLTAGSLATDSVDSDEIAAGAVDEVDLNVTNAETSGYVLSSNGAGAFTWVAQTVDTNTTYSAGTGINLGGTIFSFDCSDVAGNQLTCSGESLQVSEGSGSGLDADLLDGQEGSYYRNADNINAGTLNDLRLSSNVALLNNTQTFTGSKTFNGASTTINSADINVGNNSTDIVDITGVLSLRGANGFNAEGSILLGRSDAVARDSFINYYNDSSPAGNYVQFAVHNGTVGNTVDALTIYGDGDTTLLGDLTISGGNLILGSTDLSEADLDALDNGTITLNTETTGTLSVSNGGTGATTLAAGILLGNGTGAITSTGTLSNGQLLIGDGSGAPTAATLTSGTGITVANGAGTISISSTLGTNVDSGEIVNGTIAEVDLDISNAETSGWLLSSDGAGGFTWVDPSSVGIDEDTVEAYIFDADNTGTLSSGTLALNSLSYTGDLNDGQIANNLTISSSGNVDGAALGAGTVANGALANSSLTLTAGNGLSGGGVTALGSSATFNLGALTSNWSQTGAFDIVLNNAASELRILESAGATYYGTFDVANLGSDQTYTFNEGGNVLTSGNIASNATTGVSAGNGLTGGGTIGTFGINVGAGTGILVNANDIEVEYGSTAGTAVEGNTQITVTAGVGLTGGGSITLGSGGSVTIDSELGDTIDTTEIVNGTIQEIDLEVTNTPTDNYLLSYDTATGGFTWVDPTGVGVNEATVEAYIFDGDNSGTLSSGTLELNSLSYTGSLGVSNGGTGLSSAGSAGTIYYSNGTGFANTAVGSAGECLKSNGAGVPYWSTCGGSGSGSSLQIAYDEGNTITTTNNRNIEFNLADTTTDSDFLINLQGAGSLFDVQDQGTSKLTVDGAGNVGINDNTPSYQLDVAGTGRFTNNLLVDGNTDLGNATTDTITFNGYVDSSILPDADDTYDLGSSSLRWRDLYLGPNSLNIGTNLNNGTLSYNTTNSEFSFNTDVNVTGNLGVGVNNPGAKLTVVAQSADAETGYQSSGNYAQLNIRDSDQATSGFQLGYRWQSGVAEYGRLQTYNSGGGTPLAINPNGGNVGIGVVDPGQRLEVAGAIQAGNTSGDALYVGNDSKLTDINVANTMGVYGIQNSAIGGIRLGSGGVTITGTSGSLSYNSEVTWTLNGGYTELTVPSLLQVPNGLFISGGTAYFTNQLQARGGIQDDGGDLQLNDNVAISGTATVTSTLAANNGITVDGNTVIDNGAGWHRVYGDTGFYNGTHTGGIYMTDSTWVRAYSSTGFLGNQFYANDYIRADDYRVHNYGWALRHAADTDTGIYHASDGLLRIYANNQIKFSTAGGNFNINAALYNDTQYAVNNNVGTMCWDSLTVSGNDLYGRCSSLRSKKKNIVDLDLDLDTIRQLQPRAFDWRNSGVSAIGFIAEEVEQIDSRLSEYDENGLVGVHYLHMAALLTKGIQQLDVQVQDQESRLSVLESTTNNLTKKNITVTNQINTGKLVVTGTTQLEDLKVTGTTEVADLKVNGKIITAGDVPTVENGAVLAATDEVAIDGNDTAGTITITFDAASTPTDGELAEVTFTDAYAEVPRIALTPLNSDALDLPVFIEKTVDGFTLVTNTTPQADTTYEFDYIIIQ